MIDLNREYPPMFQVYMPEVLRFGAEQFPQHALLFQLPASAFIDPYEISNLAANVLHYRDQFGKPNIVLRFENGATVQVFSEHTSTSDLVKQIACAKSLPARISLAA